MQSIRMIGAYLSGNRTRRIPALALQIRSGKPQGRRDLPRNVLDVQSLPCMSGKPDSSHLLVFHHLLYEVVIAYDPARRGMAVFTLAICFSDKRYHIPGM